jgi:hypothetical protein
MPGRDREVLHVQLVADLERADVVRDLVRELAGPSLDREGVHHLLEHAALRQTFGFALEVETHLGLNRLVGPDPDEVDVHERALHRVALDLPGERELFGAVDLERDQRVRARLRRQDRAELVRVDRHRLGVLAEAVDDTRQAALTAQTAGGTRALVGAELGGELGVGHGELPRYERNGAAEVTGRCLDVPVRPF